MSKNEKVTENKEQKEQTEQKVMTKYDRKVQKRKDCLLYTSPSPRD